MKTSAAQLARSLRELLAMHVPVTVHGREVRGVIEAPEHGHGGIWAVIVRAGDGDDTNLWAQYEWHAEDIVDTDELATPL